ncbi:hypothetical protein [Sulfurisphaera tokodaii]|uniref:Uncharacterized protein n=2 Tax=Sulfurisphaera tokodaii TaxID=111955 RepID=Q972Q7_SULTO|nr:hypothetical protein [Sulfurisphaera tokodaii]BAB66107.1 hypothetical protein STK_10770 [Sulfurisphaera tokodaii str. 7]HII75413.1 hypothetical protein [Sulfurisphaera tokodaii]
MDKLLIVPAILILVLLSLIAVSYFYPYFVSIRIKVENPRYLYDLICFTLNVNVKKPFDCYYIINVTGIEIMGKVYNISKSFCIYTTSASEKIDVNIPNSVADQIVNESWVNMTVLLTVNIISSINTIVVRHYYVTGNFTNQYLNYLKQVYA